MATVNRGVAESVAIFGAERNLVGVFSQPCERAEAGPAIVILNTGLTHRVGHHRMFLEMARNLAQAGRSTLRFDFSGVGDSGLRDSEKGLLEANLEDVRSALDWLEATHGHCRALLVGLCAGADHAVLYSHTDSRVVGVVLLDPFIPATSKYLLQYLGRRISPLTNWRRFKFADSGLLGSLSEFARGRFAPRSRLRHLSFEGANAIATLKAIYAKNIRAGLQFLVVCTGGNYRPRQTYREQFVEAFELTPNQASLRVEFFAESDHLFSAVASRIALNDLMFAWLETTPFAARAQSVGDR